MSGSSGCNHEPAHTHKKEKNTPYMNNGKMKKMSRIKSSPPFMTPSENGSPSIHGGNLPCSWHGLSVMAQSNALPSPLHEYTKGETKQRDEPQPQMQQAVTANTNAMSMNGIHRLKS